MAIIAACPAPHAPSRPHPPVLSCCSAAVGAIVSCSLNEDWISLIGKRGFEPGQFFRPAHLAADAADSFKHVVPRMDLKARQAR